MTRCTILCLFQRSHLIHFYPKTILPKKITKFTNKISGDKNHAKTMENDVSVQKMPYLASKANAINPRLGIITAIVKIR